MREFPGDRDLLVRAGLETPTVRAARRAHERWVTIQRLWAAMDRLGITADEDRLRFVFRVLWPSLAPDWVDELVARSTGPAAQPSWVLRRPADPADVVGQAAADLIATYTINVPAVDRRSSD